MQTQTALGVTLSLSTALLWALSPLCFASAGRKIGSFSVQLLRSLGGTVLLLLITAVYLIFVPEARALPDGKTTLWIAISGFFGLAVGDGLLYEAFVTLGPRRTVQIMMIAPVASVVAGWMLMHESLDMRTLTGIAVTLLATFYAVLAQQKASGEASREPGHVTFKGITYAVAGSLCIGLGAVSARQAFATSTTLDPMVATTLRVGLSSLMIWAFAFAIGQGVAPLRHYSNGWVLSRMIPGILAGPVGGMICYVAALKSLEAGVVSTLAAISPLFILPMVWYRYRSHIGWHIAGATTAAIGGVALICLH